MSEPPSFSFASGNTELQTNLFGKPPSKTTGNLTSSSMKPVFGFKPTPNETQANNSAQVDGTKLSAGPGASGGSDKTTSLFGQTNAGPLFGNSAGLSSSTGSPIFGAPKTQSKSGSDGATTSTASFAFSGKETTTNSFGNTTTTSIFSQSNSATANSSTGSSTGSSAFGTKTNLFGPSGIFGGGAGDTNTNTSIFGGSETQAKKGINETKPSTESGSSRGSGTTANIFGSTTGTSIFGKPSKPESANTTAGMNSDASNEKRADISSNSPGGAPGESSTANSSRTTSTFGQPNSKLTGGATTSTGATSNPYSGGLFSIGKAANSAGSTLPVPVKPLSTSDFAPKFIATGTWYPPFTATPEKDDIGSQLQSIACMPTYQGMSTEELRTQDYQQGRTKPYGFASSNSLTSRTQANVASGSIFLPSNQHFRLQSLVFQVEDELFEVPNIIFSASDKFKEIYPAMKSGSSIPLLLKDCTKKQFEAFLTVLMQPYSRMFPDDHPCNVPPNLATLISALELARKWEFRQLVDDIGTKIGPLITSDAQRISLGRKFSKVAWYRQGLETLVRSDDDIALEDAEDIGPIFTVRVYHARARYRKEVQDIGVTGDTRSRVSIAANIVNTMFLDELETFAPLSTEPEPRLSKKPKTDASETSATPDVGQTECGVGCPATKAPETTPSGSPTVGVNEGSTSASSAHGTPSNAAYPQEPHEPKSPTNKPDIEQSDPEPVLADASA